MASDDVHFKREKWGPETILALRNAIINKQHALTDVRNLGDWEVGGTGGSH